MSRASCIVVTTVVGENLASLPVLSAAINMNAVDMDMDMSNSESVIT